MKGENEEIKQMSTGQTSIKIKRELIYQLLKQDLNKDQFAQVYNKIQQSICEDELGKILTGIVGKKKSVDLVPKCLKILQKENIQLPPIQLFCHQMRSKEIDNSSLLLLKSFFETGQKYPFKATLSKLFGLQHQKIYENYEKFIIEIPKEPIEGSQKIGKIKGIDIYRYSDGFITNSQKNNAKVLMVVGETGCGKSTFLNAMVNYFCQVQINDPFRYQIIIEDARDQTKSITKKINVYFVKDLKSRKVYKLIDTPGFGDTSGQEKDDNLVGMIKQKFKNQIDQIDCVMFVIKSSNTRLNHYQRYIFQSVLDLFGKDVASNFCFILTFSDGGDPLVLQSLMDQKQGFGKYWAKVLHPKYVSVNNGTYFQAIDLGDPIKQKYWSIGVQSMQKLIKRVQISKPASLILTKQMIKKKEQLYNQIRATRQKIENLSALQISITNQVRIISQYQTQINKSKNFCYEYDTFQWYSQPTEHNVTRCLNCANQNCHVQCIYGDDQDKSKCVSMDQDGNCKICPGKCNYVVHKNDKHERKQRKIVKSQTNQALKAQYDNSLQGKSTSQKAIAQKIKQIQYIAAQVNFAYVRMSKLNAQVEKISMSNKKCQSFIQYLQFQIRNEKTFKTTGYLQRIKNLQIHLKQAKINDEYMKGGYEAIQKGQLLKKLKVERYADVVVKASENVKSLVTKVASNFINLFN